MDARVMRQLHILGEERDARKVDAAHKAAAIEALGKMLAKIAANPDSPSYFQMRTDARRFAEAQKLPLPSDF